MDGWAEPEELVIPEWSGHFVEADGGLLGLLPMHVDDTRTIPVPDGWTLVDSYQDEDTEVMIFRRVVQP